MYFVCLKWNSWVAEWLRMFQVRVDAYDLLQLPPAAFFCRRDCSAPETTMNALPSWVIPVPEESSGSLERETIKPEKFDAQCMFGETDSLLRGLGCLRFELTRKVFSSRARVQGISNNVPSRIF